MSVVLSIWIGKTRDSFTAARVAASPAILISDGGGGLGKPRTIAGGTSITLIEVAQPVS